jgi:hypothetical protein
MFDLICLRRKPRQADLEMASSSKAGPVNGPPTLGKYIAGSPENAIFHGFRDLYAEILLHFQAEIMRLESELNKSWNADSNSENGDSVFSHQGSIRTHANEAQARSSLVSAGSNSTISPDMSQFQKTRELREALDQYCTYLLDLQT